MMKSQSNDLWLVSAAAAAATRNGDDDYNVSYIPASRCREQLTPGAVYSLGLHTYRDGSTDIRLC